MKRLKFKRYTKKILKKQKKIKKMRAYEILDAFLLHVMFIILDKIIMVISIIVSDKFYFQANFDF